jgi:hypothetical protein
MRRTRRISGCAADLHTKGTMHTVIDLPEITPEQYVTDSLLASREEHPLLVDRMLIEQEKADNRKIFLNDKSFQTVAKQLHELASGSIREIGASFRADCAIAARAVLSPVNYRIFCDIWLDQIKSESDITELRAIEIKREAGREFKRRGLIKIHSYFHT